MANTRAQLQKTLSNLGVDPATILAGYLARNPVQAGLIGQAQWEGMSEVQQLEWLEGHMPPKLHADMVREACAYLYPKLKSVEMSGSGGGPLETMLLLSSEQRQAAIAELEQQLGRD